MPQPRVAPAAASTVAAAPRRGQVTPAHGRSNPTQGSQDAAATVWAATALRIPSPRLPGPPYCQHPAVSVERRGVDRVLPRLGPAVAGTQNDHVAGIPRADDLQQRIRIAGRDSLDLVESRRPRTTMSTVSPQNFLSRAFRAGVAAHGCCRRWRGRTLPPDGVMDSPWALRRYPPGAGSTARPRRSARWPGPLPRADQPRPAASARRGR
jgi:hypothetical protein